MTTQQEVDLFLYQLQNSGVVNMFGAFKFVQRHFELDKSTAMKMTTSWMNNYDHDEFSIAIKKPAIADYVELSDELR